MFVQVQDRQLVCGFVSSRYVGPRLHMAWSGVSQGVVYEKCLLRTAANATRAVISPSSTTLPTVRTQVPVTTTTTTTGTSTTTVAVELTFGAPIASTAAVTSYPSSNRSAASTTVGTPYYTYSRAQIHNISSRSPNFLYYDVMYNYSSAPARSQGNGTYYYHPHTMYYSSDFTGRTNVSEPAVAPRRPAAQPARCQNDFVVHEEFNYLESDAISLIFAPSLRPNIAAKYCVALCRRSLGCIALFLQVQANETVVCGLHRGGEDAPAPRMASSALWEGAVYEKCRPSAYTAATPATRHAIVPQSTVTATSTGSALS